MPSRRPQNVRDLLIEIVARHHSRRLMVPINENVAVAPTKERRNQGIVERLEPANRQRIGSFRAALSLRRHTSHNGASRFDHRRDTSGGREFPGALCNGPARSVARPRLVAIRSRKLVKIPNRERTGLADRGRARCCMARDPGGRRHGLARRLMPVACRRLGAIVRGMGPRAGLEAAAGSAKRRPRES